MLKRRATSQNWHNQAEAMRGASHEQSYSSLDRALQQRDSEQFLAVLRREITVRGAMTARTARLAHGLCALKGNPQLAKVLLRDFADRSDFLTVPFTRNQDGGINVQAIYAPTKANCVALAILAGNIPVAIEYAQRDIPYISLNGKGSAGCHGVITFSDCETTRTHLRAYLVALADAKPHAFALELLGATLNLASLSITLFDADTIGRNCRDWTTFTAAFDTLLRNWSKDSGVDQLHQWLQQAAKSRVRHKLALAQNHNHSLQ